MPKTKSSNNPEYPAERLRGLRANPEKLGVTPLKEGEASIAMSLRGPREAITWMLGLSPAQRGTAAALVHELVTPVLASLTDQERREENTAWLRLLDAQGVPGAAALRAALEEQSTPDLRDVFAYAVCQQR